MNRRRVTILNSYLIETERYSATHKTTHTHTQDHGTMHSGHTTAALLYTTIGILADADKSLVAHLK